MLYSHSLESEKLNMFSLYLSVLLQGNNNYKNEVDTVLKETHELTIGNKDFYSISRDYFPVILFLFREDPAFFQNHSFDLPSREVYSDVFKILQRQRFIGSI